METFALVPGAATSTTADVWAAVMSLNARPIAPQGAVLQNESTGERTPLAGWTEWLVPNQQAGVVCCRLQLQGLSPRVRQQVRLVLADGRAAARAWINTLPDRVPGIDEQPFTLLLGSCFCAAEDKSGRTGKAFAALPAALHPDLKLLGGDQVYLDSPFYKFMFLPHTKQGLAETFLKNYVATWTQTGDLQGFQQLLMDGPTIFSSDDHEFWNNAPFRSFAINTWTEGGRHDWWELASGLLTAFQMPGTGTTIRETVVGDLQLLVADTRINRRDDRTTFLAPSDMDRVVAWIQGLTSPGLLSIGQPLFAPTTGITGNIADWNLPDFQQYEVLVRALLDAPQSVIILTGDVHFGRVARTVNARGAEIVEIIASPMSLVTAGGERTWHQPPGQFPFAAIPGVASRPIDTITTWQRAGDHFVTIEMWQVGGRLSLRVRTHEMQPNQSTPTTPVYEHAFQRIM
jgi:hypothetical protein